MLIGRILGSATGNKYRWPVVAILEGKSENGHRFSASNLQAHLPDFDRLPVNAFTLVDTQGQVAFDHQENDDFVGREVLNQVGWLENATWEESIDNGAGGVAAEMVLIQGDPHADRIREHLIALEESGCLDTIGLSINGEGPQRGDVKLLDRLFSIDIVTHPAAGGQIGHRIAASRKTHAPAAAGSGGDVTMKTLLQKLQGSFPRLCEGLSKSDGEKVIVKHFAKRIKEDAQAAAEVASFLQQDVAMVQNIDAQELIDQLQKVIEFVKSVTGIGKPEEEPEGEPEGGGGDGGAAPVKESRSATATAELTRVREAAETATKEVEKLKRSNSALFLKEACRSRKLPEASTKRLIAQHKDRIFESAEDADKVAKAELEYVDGLIDGARPSGLRVIRESGDRAEDIFVAWLSPRYRVTEAGKKAVAEGRDLHSSLHRWFERFGGVDIRDLKRGMAARRRMKESIDTTNLDAIYANVLNRALLAEYGGLDRYSVWEKVVRKREVQDFKTYRNITVGYYGQLPTVAKGATYNTLTTPTDREETIALTKRGGTEHILIEDLLNDDLGVYQALISRLGRTAKETRFTVVFNNIRIATQQTMSDTDKLTAARSPSNLSTTALAGTAAGVLVFMAAVEQMMAQTGGSGLAKGATPAFIVLPRALAAEWSYIRQAITGGIDKVDLQVYAETIGLMVPDAIIDHATTNTTDWFLIANPNEFPVLDFITLAGQPEPVIYVADDQRFGNMFLKDQQDLVIKDWFACAAVDWVGIQGNDVA